MSHPERMDAPKVCWQVEIQGFICYAFAETKARAQWIATKSYWDAYGRLRGEWPRASAARCPAFDNSFRKDDPSRAYAWDQL